MISVVITEPRSGQSRECRMQKQFPWRLQNAGAKVFTNAYVKLKLSLIAIDKAHCITDWSASCNVVWYILACDTAYVRRGKEFRKDFKRIGEITALVDVNTLHLCSPITVSCCLVLWPMVLLGLYLWGAIVASYRRYTDCAPLP